MRRDIRIAAIWTLVFVLLTLADALPQQQNNANAIAPSWVL
jgi:hypothetical protein